MKKRLGSKILVMILALAAIFVINIVVSFSSFKVIERSGKRISEDYVNIVSEYGMVAQCVERSQKYMNILAAVPPKRCWHPVRTQAFTKGSGQV